MTLEEYNKRCAEIVEANSNLLGVVLNGKEEKLNNILERLKEE